MNRKLIFAVIIFMTLALMGLMTIQVYWIRNAVVVKEANFVQSLDEAMANVVFKLEKIERGNRWNDRIQVVSKTAISFKILDSINKQSLKEFSGINTRDEFEKFAKKSFLTQQVIDRLIGRKMHKSIEERIDKNILDSLISRELERYGIDTQYEYGVFNITRNSLVLQKTGKYPNELLAGFFNFALYPSDLQQRENFLMIYFPNERRYLIGQLWGLLLISAVLLLIIIVSFYISVSTIFRQKKLSGMKNDFINNMTHEFKTPISTISLACEALKDKDILKTESLYNNYISIIDEENFRLKVMAEKILQTAILEKGELKLKNEWLDLSEVLNQAIKKIKLQVESKGGLIFKDFQVEGLKIKADKMHLTNVILNLLDNANKYNLEKPEILISLLEVDGGALIRIQDNGIGIGKADQKKIFDKLYRVPTGNIHNFKGFGLGLNYVQAIIDKHHGTIEVKSELTKGTTFEIFLPFGDLK